MNIKIFKFSPSNDEKLINSVINEWLNTTNMVFDSMTCVMNDGYLIYSIAYRKIR